LITGKALYEENLDGLSYSQLGKKYNLTRGQVARMIADEKKRQGEQTSYEEDNDFINIVCSSERVLNKDDIIKQFKIDLDIWEIERFIVKTSEGYRKDRKVNWQVENGIVTKGDVEDTGKMLVVPLYHVQVRLVKKVREAKAKSAVRQMIDDAKKFAPTYPKVEYKEHQDGLLYEIVIPDIHFGRLTWGEETGADFDIKIASRCVNSVVDKLLGYAEKYHIEKILLPLGNDFFNSDNYQETTARGTPQQEDTRWQKTFRKGREMAVSMIDKCSAVAPVDVLIIPGNHDMQRSFYLGEVLEAWYSNNQNVRIDNSAKIRKYYLFGKNLVGFAHGYSEKLQNLPMIMALEEPELWGKASYREIHTGDKHHKKDAVFYADEGGGIVVRILRSLAPDDAWTFSKGYKSLKAAESFLWHKDNGLIAQFTATPAVQ